MYDALNDLGTSIQQFLEDVLPSCDANWWHKCVMARLSFQQTRMVEEKGISNISGLDLAGLLRVLDQNWHEIQAVRRLQFEARNWLKEAQSIRNRWAHLPPGGLQPEDRYRDLDTVLRLMTAIGADDAVIARARNARDEVFNAIEDSQQDWSAPEPEIDPTPIKKGDVIRLKARPDHTGAVIDVLAGGGELRYIATKSHRLEQSVRCLGAASHRYPVGIPRQRPSIR